MEVTLTLVYEVTEKRLFVTFMTPPGLTHQLFLFGRSGAAKEATLPSVAKTGETAPVPTNAIVPRRAVGLSAKWPAGTGHSTCWPPPFKGARGDSETCSPPAITAPIPNARSSNHLHVSRRITRSPRPTHLPRREPRTRPFPDGSATTPPPATDMQPLTRLTHRLIVHHHLIVKQTAPTNPPSFRLATLINRKPHAPPNPTTLPKKRRSDRPNGTSAPQEQDDTRHEYSSPHRPSHTFAGEMEIPPAPIVAWRNGAHLRMRPRGKRRAAGENVPFVIHHS